MDNARIGRDLPGGAAGQSQLPPQLAAELDKAVGHKAPSEPALPPFFKTDAAPAPSPEVAVTTPDKIESKPATPVPPKAADPVSVGQAAGSTPTSPEQNQPKPANEPKPVHHTSDQEKPMASNFDYNRTSETMNNAAKDTTKQFQAGVTQAADTVRKQTEDMTRQGQQAVAQMTDRSREAMDKGMKAFDEFNTHARGNADAMMASSRAAAQGIETIVQQTAEFTRKAFESATSAMRTMASARTPQDIMQAQNEFAKAQFDNMVGEFSRMTETMMKVASSVVEPIQSSMTDTAAKATDTVKGMMNTGQTR